MGGACARDRPPPEGEKPLEWLLLTSVRVDGIESALETIEHYLRRWRVEDFFRVLKSRCRAEHLGFHRAERLERALTIQTVIAWHLMLMTLLGREVPEGDIELRFLTDYAADSGLSAPDTLAGAMRLVALLGGYQNRKHDPPPGHQSMGRGYERMSIATLGYRIAEKSRGDRVPLRTNSAKLRGVKHILTKTGAFRCCSWCRR